MKPKYTSVAAMISFEGIPDDDKLMVSVQDAWFALMEEYDFVDGESGSLSVPIETSNGIIVYVYTMRAMGDSEILYGGQGNRDND